MTSSTARLLARLKNQLPAGELHLCPEVLLQYAGDKWFASHQPDAVALPRSTRSVAAILRFANRHRIPVTPRGAGHGYVGGCVPLHGGVVLSLERMNRIREINAADFVAVVQPGVVTADLQACEPGRVGLFCRGQGVSLFFNPPLFIHDRHPGVGCPQVNCHGIPHDVRGLSGWNIRSRPPTKRMKGGVSELLY